MNDSAPDCRSLLLALGTEVRHSLHHMMGLLDLAAAEAQPGVVSSYLSQCRLNADQLLQLTNDASELAFEGHGSLTEASFCLPEMLDEVVEAMRTKAAGKGLTFNWSLDPGVPQLVHGDRGMIQDTLRRVLDNAIKFTPIGEVVATVRVSKIEGDSIVFDLEISDTGPGAPPNAIPSGGIDIQEIQLRRLGLAILEKRLLVLGGVLALDSDRDGAIPIRLSLPMKLAAGAKQSRLDIGRTAAPLRVLVAEDSDESFALFQVYVKGDVHEVSRALDGAQAVEMVKSGVYDMVMMDIDMPVMDGFTATRAIREWETQQGCQRLPIIVLSAMHLARQKGLGASAGCSGYLMKPILKTDLLQAIQYYAPIKPA